MRTAPIASALVLVATLFGIVFGSVQPEMKEALRALHDLYERGIIDAEFAVRPADKVPDEIASERVGMINGPFWISLWPLMDSINVNPEADWLPLIPGTVDGTEFGRSGTSPSPAATRFATVTRTPRP